MEGKREKKEGVEVCTPSRNRAHTNGFSRHFIPIDLLFSNFRLVSCHILVDHFTFLYEKSYDYDKSCNLL